MQVYISKAKILLEMTGGSLSVLHNGYAGMYIQSQDSSLTNTTVDIRCNGEKLLSYSAGDLWLNDHGLTVTDCTSLAMPGSAWLGGVGRTGSVTTLSGSIVAHDLPANVVATGTPCTVIENLSDKAE